MQSKLPLALGAIALIMGSAVVCADSGNIDAKVATCNGCHQPGGAGPFPAINGQPAEYLKNALLEYKESHRPATMMSPALLGGLSDSDIAGLAEHFSKQPWTSVKNQKLDPALVKRGKDIAEDKCAMCHGAGGRDSYDDMPRLGGQRAAFLVTEMEEYHDPHGKAHQPHGMKRAIKGLSADDMQALAAYFASQE